MLAAVIGGGLRVSERLGGDGVEESTQVGGLSFNPGFRVDGCSVVPYFEVEVGSGRKAGGSDGADALPGTHSLTDADGRREVEMPVCGVEIRFVFDHDERSVGAEFVGPHHGSAGGGPDSGSGSGAVVDAAVKALGAEDGVGSLSPSGLDPDLFESTVVYFPSLSQRGGWDALRTIDGEAQPIGPEGAIALVAVTDDAVVGPFSVRETLLIAIPGGSLILAGIFALVAGTGLRPVRRMTIEADSVEIGDLDRRLADPGTGDELDELAATLNRMLDRVSQGVTTERRFVADAAHELRSPIAASTALLEVSLTTSELDWKTAAASVLDEQRRLATLVDDLVLLARLDDQGHTVDRTETVMVDDIVVTETSRPFLAAIDVTDIEPAAVDADRRSLERVVRNLLSNADRQPRPVSKLSSPSTQGTPSSTSTMTDRASRSRNGPGSLTGSPVSTTHAAETLAAPVSDSPS